MTRSFLTCANPSLWKIQNKTMNGKIDFSKKGATGTVKIRLTKAFKFSAETLLCRSIRCLTRSLNGTHRVISPSLQKPVMVSEPLTVGKSIQSHALQIMWRCAVQTVGGETRLDTPLQIPNIKLSAYEKGEIVWNLTS